MQASTGQQLKFTLFWQEKRSIKLLFYDGIHCLFDCIIAFSQHLSLCEESPCWAVSPLLSGRLLHLKDDSVCKNEKSCLFQDPLAMGIWRREVREDEVRERQHPAQYQLGSVYQCWCILSGPDCFTSDSISNSTRQTFTRDNRTLNCTLQNSTMTAHFFSDLGPRRSSLHGHFRKNLSINI